MLCDRNSEDNVANHAGLWGLAKAGERWSDGVWAPGDVCCVVGVCLVLFKRSLKKKKKNFILAFLMGLSGFIC